MKLLDWEKLPTDMQTEAVREYYDILKKKKCGLFFKRAFDVLVSFIMLSVLWPIFLILALIIKIVPSSAFQPWRLASTSVRSPFR